LLRKARDSGATVIGITNATDGALAREAQIPIVIPIFDKQVLLSVGVTEKGANQKLRFLEPYIVHATVLARTHGEHFSSFENETPIRLVDMALWVVRGGCN